MVKIDLSRGTEVWRFHFVSVVLAIILVVNRLWMISTVSVATGQYRSVHICSVRHNSIII